MFIAGTISLSISLAGFIKNYGLADRVVHIQDLFWLPGILGLLVNALFFYLWWKWK